MPTEIVIKQPEKTHSFIIEIRNLHPEVKRLLDIVRDGWIENDDLADLLGRYLLKNHSKFSCQYKSSSNLILNITQNQREIDYSLINNINKVINNRLKEEEFYVEQLIENGFELDIIDQARISTYRQLCSHNFQLEDFV